MSNFDEVERAIGFAEKALARAQEALTAINEASHALVDARNATLSCKTDLGEKLAGDKSLVDGLVELMAKGLDPGSVRDAVAKLTGDAAAAAAAAPKRSRKSASADTEATA